MVAYSFNSYFVPQIVSGRKNQTVRRYGFHASPGESQFFDDRAEKYGPKFLDPDPICVDVRPVVIETSPLLDCVIAAIAVDNVWLNHDEIEAFARAVGFAPEHLNGLVPGMCGRTARDNMGTFWRDHHRAGRFEGVRLRWRQAGPTPGNGGA